MGLDIQQLLYNVTTVDNVIRLPAGEFKGPFYIRRPCVVKGTSTTLWAPRGPVLIIESGGVTLENLRIEVTEQSLDKNDFTCLIVNSTDTHYRDVEILGGVRGVPSEEEGWDIPKAISLGEFPVDTNATFAIEVDVPNDVVVRSTIKDITLMPCKLKPGRNRVIVSTGKYKNGTFLYGEILFESIFIRRSYLSGTAQENCSGYVPDKVVYQAKGRLGGKRGKDEEEEGTDGKVIQDRFEYKMKEFEQEMKEFEQEMKESKQKMKESKQKIEDCMESIECLRRELEEEEEQKFKRALIDAEAGNARAQYHVADCYHNGNGVAKSLKAAFQWYSKAALQGFPPAENALAVCYFCGEGVEKDLNQAFNWYLRSADNGYAFAQYNLAYFYETVKDNPKKAFYWFALSAKQYCGKSQYHLGRCYEEGIGTEADHQKALEWYDKAAKQGIEYAAESAVRLRKKIKKKICLNDRPR